VSLPSIADRIDMKHRPHTHTNAHARTHTHAHRQEIFQLHIIINNYYHSIILQYAVHVISALLITWSLSKSLKDHCTCT